MKTKKIHFEKASLIHEKIIFRWLAEPHMQEFWDNTQEHKDDILNFIHGRKQHYFYGTTRYWVGYIDDQPFSFILTDELLGSQNLTALHRQYLSKTGHTVGLDFGIGNTAFLGKGLASLTLEAFVDFYYKNIDPKADFFFIDPDKNNPRAIHVYEKAGFKMVGNFLPTAGAFTEQESYLMIKEISSDVDEDDPIELVPYQSEWRDLAEKEIKILRDTLPTQHILDIQHVGSTAIPDIQSKPIIDIQIAVDSLMAIKPIAIDALKNLGYEYWADNPDTERMFFVKGRPPASEKRTHHVHVVEPASHHWQGKILFRDYLLSHPDEAKKYEALKIKLAKQFANHREKYTDAKTNFVNDILQKAKLSDKTLSPFVVFLTGASGVGKTTIVNILKTENKNNSVVFLHFDSIGVPSVEEMNQKYGSPSEWQKAMTYHWVTKILLEYKNKDLVIIEGQVNLDYLTNAFTGLGIQQYKIILIECDNSSRHQRLHKNRNQPELINEEMDNWARFLKKQAEEKSVAILNTSAMNQSEMVKCISDYIEKNYVN